MKKSGWILTLILLLVPVCLCAQKRGMVNKDAVFIEKGTRSAGLSFGWDSWNSEDDGGVDLLGVVEGFDGNVRQVSVSASGAWFVRDNVSLGVNLGYDDVRLSIDSIIFLGSEHVNKNLMREAVEGSLTCRGYLPLFDGRVAALFVEGRLSGMMGYTKHYDRTARGKEGTYSDIYRISMGAYAGLSVFATENLSVEVSLPMLEGGCNWQVQDGTSSDGSTLAHGFVRFKPFLTGIRMGMVYHF